MKDFESSLLKAFAGLRSGAPLVHNITNFVVMDFTANALLAVGASPVMAHAAEEVEELAEIASALVLNMGTLEKPWVESMLSAGRQAFEKGVPVVFDPVGAGATSYRRRVSREIVERCSPGVIRGNASEILSLAASQEEKASEGKGVDSLASSERAEGAARLLAGKFSAVVAVSGETDLITDGERLIKLKNGSPLMCRVTGMGCTATAVIGAFLGAEPPVEGMISGSVNERREQNFRATSYAMALMGLAGEKAAKKADGPGSLRMHFLDALDRITAEGARGKAEVLSGLCQEEA